MNLSKSIFRVPLLLLFTVVACVPKDAAYYVDEGAIDGNTYTSKEIGWTIEIPQGWNLKNTEQAQESAKNGLKAIEETVGTSVDYSSFKNLIGFEKDQFNMFLSTSEPFLLEYEGEWEENNALLKQVIFETYQNQGIPVDSSTSSIETVSGLDFVTYEFTIYGSAGEIILTQILYCRLINGYDFSVNLNFNNELDKAILLDAFRNSKFTINH